MKHKHTQTHRRFVTANGKLQTLSLCRAAAAAAAFAKMAALHGQQQQQRQRGAPVIKFNPSGL